MRLTAATLAELPADVDRPAYDPRALRPGIVHLGIGAFHRAHQALYVEEALAASPGAFGIVGVSLRSPDVRDRLRAQDGLYTLVERGPERDRLRVVGCVRDVLFAPADPAAVVARIADPSTRLVSLTVTEKGYCHDPATGRLDESHPDVRHDLERPEWPRSAVGVLVAGLSRRVARLSHRVASFSHRVASFSHRRASKALPLTVLCCDNLPRNGRLLEDRFAGPRPALEAAGAELVRDVAPFEAMKLRLLNGSHSAIAYLGYLGGYAHVSEAVADPAYRAFVRRLMDQEVTPTLHVPPGVDLAAYAASLLDRFANPRMAHRTWQIAMDGSQKLPQRLLGTVRGNLAAGRPVSCLALAVAAFLRYMTGRDEAGRPIDVRDPLASRFRDVAARSSGDPAALARAMLGVREVFGDDLPTSPAFADAVAGSLVRLYRHGARVTVAQARGSGLDLDPGEG